LAEFVFNRNLQPTGLLIEKRTGARRALGVHGKVDDCFLLAIQYEKLGVLAAHLYHGPYLRRGVIIAAGKARDFTRELAA
jgi:hypothetical protein